MVILVPALSMAVPQIDLFEVTCFSTWIHGFSPRAVRREFVVDWWHRILLLVRQYFLLAIASSVIITLIPVPGVQKSRASVTRWINFYAVVLIIIIIIIFNYTLQPLRLILRFGLDVPTFATRRLHACHHAWAPGGGRWNCGQEMSGNFA